MANQDNALPSMETMIYTTHMLRERKKIQDFFGDTQGCKDTKLRRRLRLHSEDVLISCSYRNTDSFCTTRSSLGLILHSHRIRHAYTTLHTEATLYSYWQTFGSLTLTQLPMLNP